jgi:hypothetical protein
MAVKTRAELKAENAADFPDNTTRQISAADLRGQLDDIVDSAVFPEDDVGGGGGGAGGDFTADYSPAAEERTVTDRLSSEVFFSDVLTETEREQVAAGNPTFDAGARLETLINDTAGYDVASQFSAGRVIRLPHGTLLFKTPCNIKHTVHIIGEGRGDNANVSNTTILCEQGVEGFIINYGGTYGAGLDDGSHGLTGAVETIIEGMMIVSQETWDATVGTRLGLVNGIRVRNKCTIRNVMCSYFPGAGIHQYCAASTSFADRLGNSNYAYIDKVKLISNLIGWYVDGGDANVVHVGLMDVQHNKVWGILTGCLLGNHVLTVHASFNGNSNYTSAWHNYARWLFRGGTMGPFGMLGPINATGGNSEPGVDAETYWEMGLPDDSSFPATWSASVAYDGETTFLKHASKRWRAIQDVPAGIEPGTDGGVYWEDFGVLDAAAGWTEGAFEVWDSTIVIGSKRTYSGIRWTALHASSLSKWPGFDNPDWEFRGFQSRANTFHPLWDSGATYYPGGAFGSMEANAPNKIDFLYVEGEQRIVTASQDHIAGGIYSTPGPTQVQAGLIQWGTGWRSASETTHPDGFGTMTFNGPGAWIRWNYNYDAPQGTELRQDTTNHCLRMIQGGANDVYRITQSNSIDKFGRTNNAGGGNFFVRKLFVGLTTANARQIDVSANAPTTGEAARGDFVINRNPTATNSIFGWRCITGGVNGVDSVWQAVYISPTPL